MSSDDELPLRPGDVIWVESRKKHEDGERRKITSVTYNESRADYVTVQFENGGRTRHIPIAQIEDILIARAEDMRSPKTLELRYMETMLMSQLAILEKRCCKRSGEFSSYRSQLELQRSLYAVREHLRHRNARSSADTYTEPTDVSKA